VLVVLQELPLKCFWKHKTHQGSPLKGVDDLSQHVTFILVKKATRITSVATEQNLGHKSSMA
jgi:hypothetical protein